MADEFHLQVASEMSLPIACLQVKNIFSSLYTVVIKGSTTLNGGFVFSAENAWFFNPHSVFSPLPDTS
jgi:hypothetical protein